MAQETLTNLRIGSGEVKWGAKNLGFTTEDGAVVTIVQEGVDVTVDKFGASVVERFSNGFNCTVKVTLMETAAENIADVWATAFPAKGSGSGADRLDLDYADVRNKSLRSLAQTLRIRVRNAEGQAGDEDLVVWKAIATEVGDISFNNEGVRTLEVTFMGLYDETNGLLTFGDSLA